jgi:lambda family phage tail tape measure protein
MKEATNSIEVFKEIGEKSFGELKNVLADFVMTGKLNFQDFARTITRMVIEALIGSAIQSALAKATELFKMKSIREALINVYTAGTRAFAQGGVLGPFLAAGVIASGLALVRANQPALVGEKGPEIIMPRRDMEVIPNKKISGMGGTVNVNFTINAVDTRGFRSLLNNEKGTIVNIINQAVTDKGRPVLV